MLSFKSTMETATAGLSIPSESLIARNQVVTELDKIKAVTTAAEQDLAVEILTRGKKILKDVETVRADLKKPVTALGNAIQKLASDFSEPLQAKLNEKLKLVSAFQFSEAARVRKEEEARQAAIREALRLEEEQKQKLLAAQQEALRLEDEARQAAIAADTSAANPVTANDATTAVADEDGASDIQALLAEEAVNSAAAEVAQSSTAVVALITANEPEKAKSKGLSSRMVWKYEIMDARAAFAVHPELFKLEPKASAINSAKSNDNGFECDGIRFWEEAASSLRV